MQMAVIEFARNILKIKNASSSEISKNGVPVVGLINEWEKMVGCTKERIKILRDYEIRSLSSET